MYERMLFSIPKERHSVEHIREDLGGHPEVQFVSLVGLDIGGHDTDEKIPVELALRKLESLLARGVQTDGSSVVLPRIAELNDAKVDIIPDPDVDWYVDYNFEHVLDGVDLPVGTLRIPSFLIHNDASAVGSREILKRAAGLFAGEAKRLIAENPYVLSHLDMGQGDAIDEVFITAATELEFWVKTPEDKGDREQLSTSQELKEQYWQRTRGSVRTALEKTIILLNRYGFNVEMGHKEVGGIKAKLESSGGYSHIMEQLEIDWEYSTALQAADNELTIKYIVKDVFRYHGLEVSFMAKPIDGVAGSGEHTHIGVAARLKSGRLVNLFAPRDASKDFMSPIGFGALMGILKNYEAVNPFITASNDALNRLKAGFEAPVCIVTSIGHDAGNPSRNRTVLAGLVRDMSNPLATRFELRSPNPKSNTYLVLAASCLAMLDGIEAALAAGKAPGSLLESLSKRQGEDDFYLEKGRVYRSEKDVFEEYSHEERCELFGKAPETVWENILALSLYPEKTKALKRGGVFSDALIESYKAAIVAQWATELENRIVSNVTELVRECRKLHDSDCTDFDVMNWTKIGELRNYLCKDMVERKCLLTRIKAAIREKDYDAASAMQIEMQEKAGALQRAYAEYRKNLL
ncbi:MAG: glutamine synthetase [Clostridiales Family XIII bacterium]|nr:glutamine synthetase [Clostridiales Family XIII bacterium]